MAAGLKLLGVGAALAAFLMAGVSCASEQPPPSPPASASATATATGAPIIAPPPAPTVTRAATPPPPPPTATDRADVVAPQRPTALPTPKPADRTVVPGQVMTAADFPTPPDRDLRQLARELRWDGVEPTPGPARFAGATLAVGATAEFWTLDYPRREMARKTFTLAAVSERAYWWVEQGLKFDNDDLQRSVASAEGQVYPRVTAVFGEPLAMGESIGRGHVINGRIPGVGGYVSGADPYPAAVQPFSNEAPAIYINADAVPLGSEEYLNVLAHELQHAIHWYADSSEETWLNEGLSELAVTEAGLHPGSMFYYLRRPNVSLVNWPDELGGDVGRNYGAGALFAHYLRERYAPEGDLRDLLAGQRNGIAAVDDFLQQRGAVATEGGPADFHTVFADWMVANLLDREDAGYGYANLDLEARITRTARVGDDDGAMVSLAQYGIDYVELEGVAGAVTVHFEGVGETPLLPVDAPAAGCWWSNRGDNIASTLTAGFAIPEAAAGGVEPTLTFNRWYSIEENWDYLYLEASTDGGATWDVLSAAGTTDVNPLGNSYGHGYTGKSDWREVTVSLAAYAGQRIMARFHYVTDDAIHGPGACISDMKVSWNEARADGWQPDGFALVNNRVRQEWLVWLIGDGAQPTATRLALEWDPVAGRYAGAAPAPASGAAGRVVIAVAPAAPATLQPGRYRVWAVAGR